MYPLLSDLDTHAKVDARKDCKLLAGVCFAVVSPSSAYPNIGIFQKAWRKAGITVMKESCRGILDSFHISLRLMCIVTIAELNHFKVKHSYIIFVRCDVIGRSGSQTWIINALFCSNLSLARFFLSACVFCTNCCLVSAILLLPPRATFFFVPKFRLILCRSEDAHHMLLSNPYDVALLKK